MRTARRNYVSEKRSKTLTNEREKSLPIPEDLIIEICSWLPVKSIARCRCLSKVWTSILVLPYFTELFLKKSLARPKLYFACYKNGEIFFFSSPQPQNPDEHSSPVATDRLMHISINGYFEISAPVHGLVCIVNNTVSKVVVQIICNLSTGQALTLPTMKKVEVIGGFKVTSFLGYDPIDKQFKVLSMTWIISRGSRGFSLVEYQVLTLGTRKLSWRMVNCCILHCSRCKAICINGVLYYPANKLSSGYITEGCIIVCFDVRSEKFSSIEIKETCIKAIMNGALINYNGKLGSLVCEGSGCVSGRSKSIELCVLEDFEKQEWSNHTYVLPPLWKNVVQEANLYFLGVIGTNEIVLSDPFCLIYYNVEKRTVVRIGIQGIEAFDHHSLYTFKHHIEDVKLMKVL